MDERESTSEYDPLWGAPSPGESRWPPALAVVAALVLQVRLPEKLSLGKSWLLPALESVLLAALIAVNPSQMNARSRDTRWVGLTLISVMSATNAVSLILLVHNLLKGSKVAGRAIEGRPLVYSAIAIWLTGVIAFGLWYWEIDRGGPIRRCWPDHKAPDFLFPQMENPGVHRHDGKTTPWHPVFVDYLYLSLTNSAAFSPTDTLPLTTRAKMLMGAQSLASLATIAVVGARAVNILS
jgi:uncharacterized membrane protein